MTDKEMWKDFCRQCTNQPERYDSWSFGDDPDTLAALVFEGRKTATASVLDLYELDREPLPKVGDYSVILDSSDRAVCVIRDVDVAVVPFGDVDEKHARLEGEGDLSLAYWRDVHRQCFSEWMSESGLVFSEDTKVVLEKFEVVYRP